MRKAKIIIVAVVMVTCLLTLSAVARLGESNIEIAKRYGPVEYREEAGTNQWRGVYSFKQYMITCTFETNICIKEVVIPLPLRKGKFSEAEVTKLCNDIGGSGAWKL